jgi:glycosyltransferase involved in cell wall biosynthesis
MRLAVFADLKTETPLFREGLWIYSRFVLEALLKTYPELTLEIWHYACNKTNVNALYAPLLEQFPERLTFFNEGALPPQKLALKTQLMFVGKQWFYRSLFAFSGQRHFIKELSRTRKKWQHQLNAPHPKATQFLQQSLQRYSTAQVAYVPYVGFNLAFSFNGSVVMQVHDLFPMALQKEFSEQNPKTPQNNQVSQKKLTVLSKKKGCFVSATRYIAEQHVRHFVPAIQAHQVAVVPFPPMLTLFQPETLPEEHAFKAQYKLPSVYIAYPSQLRPNKNGLVLLQALNYLKQQGNPVTLVTTGTFKHVPSLSQYIAQHQLEPYIIEVGSLDLKALYALYYYSNLVVVPTLMEGPGISMQALEALKIGKPVIHSKAFGVEDSLNSVGLSFETADLNWFNPYDDVALSSKIVDVLQNPAAHVEKQRHVIKAYEQRTWNDVAKQYMALMQAMLNKEALVGV